MKPLPDQESNHPMLLEMVFTLRTRNPGTRNQKHPLNIEPAPREFGDALNLEPCLRQASSQTFQLTRPKSTRNQEQGTQEPGTPLLLQNSSHLSGVQCRIFSIFQA